MFMLKQQGSILCFPTNLTKTMNLSGRDAPLTIFPYACLHANGALSILSP